MANAPGGADVVAQEPSCEGTCDVLCLIKRSGYELVVAAPMQSPTWPSWEQVRVQDRLKQRGQAWECILTRRELQTFYEDLAVVMEYLRHGRAEPQDTLVAVGRAAETNSQMGSKQPRAAGEASKGTPEIKRGQRHKRPPQNYGENRDTPEAR
jgi:hypothetical protein